MAQTCPSECPQKMGCPLQQPPTIWPENGVLDTELTVRLRDACVPVAVSGGIGPTTVSYQQMTLRNYHSPVTPAGSLPGPTLRVRKATLQDPTQDFNTTTNPVVTPGSRLRILLRNELPNDPAGAHACREAEFWVCSQDAQTECVCPDPDNTDCNVAADFTCPNAGDIGDCRKAVIDQVSPNCFHGPEVTNLHYHGTHISPQPHQDFVLLNLYSANQVNPAPPEEDTFNAVGSYQTDINPFPWNQAPGTHWYHPHKHGSTAIQLINGLAGALLIAGELDDYLFNLYGVDPSDPAALERFEKVLVVQQIWEDVLFYRKGRTTLANGTIVNGHPTGYPPYPLINGQLVPEIEMSWGEVQRWRLISATTNASTQMAFAFPSLSNLDNSFPGFQVLQIAQDGVQFAHENVDRQPLGNAADGFRMSPGNRVDLLVRAPDPPADANASMTFYVMHDIVGHVSADVRERFAAKAAAINKALGIPPSKHDTFTAPLLKVTVHGTANPIRQMPTTWPDMPSYLADLVVPANQADRDVAFSMSNTSTGGSANGSVSSKFYVDGLQYHGDCAGETLTLGETEQWRITNNSAPNHPFHIHINPFQLISQRWRVGNTFQSLDLSPPYPWMDTIALPTGTPNRHSVTKIRQRYDDYTGAYVLHCHFLGHEDRGMMSNVQTVCADTAPSLHFGTTHSDGEADNCGVAATDTSPLTLCPGTLVGGE